MNKVPGQKVGALREMPQEIAPRRDLWPQIQAQLQPRPFPVHTTTFVNARSSGPSAAAAMAVPVSARAELRVRNERRLSMRNLMSAR